MIDLNVERRRLAQLMHCDESELDYLSELGGEGLMQIRMRFQDSLIDDFEPYLAKFAATSSITPPAISEKICARYLGPTLTSYMSYFTPIKTITKLSNRFKTDFLIELSKELIPERAKEMLAALPADMMRPVTRGLVDDGAWGIMGGFVDHLPPETSIALMEEVPDPVACLWISSYTQNKSLIAGMVSQFDEQTLLGLVTGSVTHHELMREICVVAENLPAETLARIDGIREQISEEDQATLKAFAEANGFETLATQYA